MDLIIHWGITDELRSSKYKNSNRKTITRRIKMMLHYLVKSAIFEAAAFAIASIIGYFIVYRWFPGKEDCIE
jgi:hypothetical protein